MNTSDYYVLLDAMSIQGYVFDTSKTKIIVGASLALAQWQKVCRNMCKGALITSAGGNVLAGFSNGTDARKFKDDAIKVAPPGIEVAWAICKTEDGDTTNTKTWKTLQREIARFKAGDREPDDYPDTPFNLKKPRCKYCGLRPESMEKREGKEICDVCKSRYDAGEGLKSNQAGNTPIEELYKKASGLGLSFPEDLEDLVQRPGKDGEDKDLLAVVVIDLNDMGKTIKEIIHSQGFDGLKTFSESLDNELTAIFTSQLASLRSSGDAWVRKNGGKEILRLRPLLFGGDDIVMAMSAPLWPDFVTAIFEEFRRVNLPYWAGACAGIACAKHNYPLNRLVEMAEKLVASAKMVVRQNSDIKFALDWHLHQEAAFSLPSEVRKRNWLHVDDLNYHYLSTRRPYPYEEFKTLKQDAKRLAYANRKLYSLYKALRTSVQETRDTLVYEFLRNENNRLDKYDELWEHVRNTKGVHPLWEQVDKDEHPSLTVMLHDTRFADMLEMKFTVDAPKEGVENP
jgi:hypothetical protein